jgi:hypothetical protein
LVLTYVCVVVVVRAGVLRTEIQPSHDRVTVVGDVDVNVLVKKLAKVGKIAEALPPAPAEQGKKQRDDGDRAVPAQAQPQAEEKCKGKDDAGGKAAAKAAPGKHEGCKKCAREAAARAVGDSGDHCSGKKAPSKKDNNAGGGWGGEEGGDADADGLDAEPLAVAPHHHYAQAQTQQHYHRAEPAMVVPVHAPPTYYYPPPAAAAMPYYGYYGMPPPPPPTAMVMAMGVAPPSQRHTQARPQPSRFDEDFFDDDNTVGCSVM